MDGSSLQLRTETEHRRFTDPSEAVRALIAAKDKGAVYSNQTGKCLIAKGFLPKN